MPCLRLFFVKLFTVLYSRVEKEETNQRASIGGRYHQVHLRHHASAATWRAPCSMCRNLPGSCFLRILDEIEEQERIESEAVSGDWSPALEKAISLARLGRAGRRETHCIDRGRGRRLSPICQRGNCCRTSKGLRDNADASVKQKVISEILSGVDKVGMDTERNFLDVLDKVGRAAPGKCRPDPCFHPVPGL